MYSNYFLGVKSPEFFLITISLSLSDLYNLFALPCIFIPEISVYQFTQIAKSMRGCRIFIYFYRDGGGGGPSDNYIVWGRGKSETYFWLFDYVNLMNLNFQGWKVGGGGRGQDPFDPRPLDSHMQSKNRIIEGLCRPIVEYALFCLKLYVLFIKSISISHVTFFF